VYCALAGAKKIYAIEASSIYIQAEAFIKENGCDEIVELIHGKVEEVSFLHICRLNQFLLIGRFTCERS
jgi:hypothetical protein